MGTGTIEDHPRTPDGILPLLDYSGDLRSRHALTGDWAGWRDRLAERGISAELSFNTTAQGGNMALMSLQAEGDSG